MDAEEFKKKADAIWSSFLKETKPSTKAVTSSEPIVPSSSVETKLAEPSKASVYLCFFDHAKFAYVHVKTLECRKLFFFFFLNFK